MVPNSSSEDERRKVETGGDAFCGGHTRQLRRRQALDGCAVAELAVGVAAPAPGRPIDASSAGVVIPRARCSTM